MVSFAYRVYKWRSSIKSQNVLIIVLVLAIQASGNNLYVSKAHGHDNNNTCQHITSPCQTLRYVINKTTGYEVIMLDPENTEKIPYNTCPTEPITKPLTFNSLNGPAIINCSGNGLKFFAPVELEGLKFLDTFLRIDDGSLTINKCSFGSFKENVPFLYIIEVSVTKPQGNLKINVTSSTTLKNNTAGTLKIVNHQSVPVFVKINNVKIANNYIVKANSIIFIQGYVNFDFINSEISRSKFSGKISKPSLVYFFGCPANARANKNASTFGKIPQRTPKHLNSTSNPERRTWALDENSTILTYYINGVNFSYNHAGTVRTLFCTRGQVMITNTAVLNNTNKWISGGAIVIDTKYAETLEVIVRNCSFVSNLNKDTGPMLSVVSQNLALSVTNCSFFHNLGGAVYVVTLRESKVSFRSSRIKFCSSTKYFLSHCGAQMCVMFRYKDEYDMWIRAREKDRGSEEMRLATGSRHVTAQTKGRGAPLNDEKGEPLDANVNGQVKRDNSGNLSSKNDGPQKPKTGTLESKNNGLLEIAGPLNLDDSRPFESMKRGHADSNRGKYSNMEVSHSKLAIQSPSKNNEIPSVDSNRDKPSKLKITHSELPKVSSLEYKETTSLDPGLLVEDCELYNNTGLVFSNAALEIHSEPYISLSEDSRAFVQVRRCVFVGNVAKEGTGGIYAAVNIGVNISNTTFHSNAGSESGAIYFTGSTMTLQNCTLDSNSGGYSGYSQATGSVRLTKNGSALIQESRIIQRSVAETISDMGTYHGSLAVSSNDFDKIVLSNSVLDYRWSPSLEKIIVLEISHTTSFQLKKGASIECPRGYEIKRHRIGESGQSFECNLCPMGSYSIDRGIYRHNRSHPVECLLCPYGARCTKGLEALPNFWGYKIKNNPPTIQFSQCPRGYCCQGESRSKRCVPYDTCNSRRNGRLCGKCKPGFTETLFTPSCRKSEKCNDYWFWPMGVIFVLGFSLYLIIQPDIVAILYRSITWFRPTPPQAPERDAISNSGPERIVFFYYQAIDILSVQSSNNTFWDDHLTQFTLGLFNFDLRLNREGFACPFPGLSSVSKLLFHTLGVFSVLFAIPFIFLLHKAASMCLPRHSPKNGVYLSAFLKSVFLGYTVLARKSLTLLQCVTVDGVNCLFVNCNIECYTWWQTVIGTLVLVFFFPFVLVLFFGSGKLYKKQITVTHFLLACLFPLPVLSYWFLNRRHLDGNLVADTGGQTAITSVLIGSYRVPDHVSAGAIYWESVLIGRMLVLVIAVLIKDPFLRSLVLLLLCVINLSLHIHVRPFELVLDNRVETISLSSLVLMAMFNLPFMAYLSEGVSPTGPISKFIDGFSWCKFVLVGFLPFIGAVLVFVALVSQAVRLLIFLTKSIRLACFNLACRCFGQSQPQEELDDPLME